MLNEFPLPSPKFPCSNSRLLKSCVLRGAIGWPELGVAGTAAFGSCRRKAAVNAWMCDKQVFSDQSPLCGVTRWTISDRFRVVS